MRISDWSSDVCSSDLEDQLIYQVNDEPRPRESEVLTTESAVDSELIGTAVFDATGEKSSMPSWDELVRQHGDRVYRLAYRLSGDAQDAEDLTQDTFIRVFRSLSDYQPGTFERSEEHTSELQSLMRISYAVFCLKNKKKHQTN